MSLLEVRYSDSRRVQFDWNETAIAKLTHMWVTEEMSSGQIAAELGVTRSTVIGKVSRLGLNGRACDVQNRSKGAEMREARNRLKAARLAERAARAPRPAMRCEPAVEIQAIAPCSLIELTDENCHWPIGEVGQPGFHFCGGRVGFRSYCVSHAAIAYRRN